MPHAARETIRGVSFLQDRLWLVTTPDFTAGFTEYNQEVTGADPRLYSLSRQFCYGGNAYYIIYTLCPKNKWEVTFIEDREKTYAINP